jgi:diguanylate cyclase (GGDEF)-like protein
MANMRDVVKDVLSYIKEQGLQPTPEIYREVFCKKANEQGVKFSECDKLTSLAKKLSSQDQDQINEMKIGDVDSLFDFVLDKLKTKESSMLGNGLKLSDTTVEKLASLMLLSLMPSYEDKEMNQSINQLSKKINDDPTLIESSEIQNNIRNLIEQRIDSDQQAITDKAEKISQFITKVSTLIDDTVSHNSESSDSLQAINGEIKSITFEDLNQQTFENFKTNLISISSQMQEALSKLNNKLSDEQNEVSILREKIKSLESSLQTAQAEGRTDFLTGLLTRRAIDREVKVLDENFLNNLEDFIVVLIDLDNFKTINDRYGHDGGDVVLSTFAKILQKKSQNNAVIARYGGEEFIILLKKSTTSDARNLLIQIREFIHKTKFLYNNLSIKVTFSAGLALRSSHETIEEVIKEADKLLYKAKHLGKDRIEYK